MKWAEHKLLKPPSDEEMALMEPEELIALHTTYHEAIKNAAADPYRYGFSLPHWAYADELLGKFRTTLLLGANRSGKTSYAARKIVQSALANPNGLIFCFAQTHEISVLVQQRAVWEALPAEYRIKKVNDGSISFTYKNGFSDKKAIFPNRTQIVFKTYTQYQQDDTILEGMELGSPEPTTINIGCWLDEYLLGMEMIDRIMLRNATHNAKLLISFTPKDGETETVRYYRNAATTVESKHVEEGLTTPRTVPYVQHNERMNTGISYFHSKDNPWSGYESLLEQCIAKGDDDYALTALYGVPTTAMASKFPRFNPDVNVLPHAEVEEKLKDCTLYMVVDPAGSKPWFITWIGVDATDTWYVYREWPGIQHGKWAEEKNGKWAAGEACKQRLGYGVKDYVELIRELEGQEKMMTRLIDPRMGANKYSSEHGGQSDYISDLEHHGLIMIPAPGIDEEPGLQAIQDKLSYNPQKPIDAQNRPHFYISDELENTISSMQHYDGRTRDHPWKDPIDCYDGETEVLTSDGWVKFPEYFGQPVATMNGDGFLEWQVPTEVIARPHKGKMIMLDGKRVNFCVTPNHRMYVHPQKSDDLVVRKAKDLLRQDTIPISTRGVRPHGVCADAYDVLWYELIGWYLGDGCASSNMGGKIQIPGRGYSVYISQSRESNPEKCRRIEHVLNSLGYKFAYRHGSYVVSNKDLWNAVIGLGNCYTKKIPSYAFTASRECIDAMLYGLQNSDGWTQGGLMRYASVSKDLTDGVQALMLIAGKPTGTIYVKKAEDMQGGRIKATADQFWVSERSGNRLSITNKKKEFLPKEIDYDGMVYCLSVPNETLIVRRKGQPMVCGNCLRYAAVYGIDYVSKTGLQATRPNKGGY